MSAAPILPGPVEGRRLATLGVMGGGQLGRMFVHAAQALGFQTAVLDPDPISPAGRASDVHIATAYDDEQGLAQLMQRCEAITTEFENVPAGALATLAAQRPVAPAPTAVAIAQDRIAEKAHFATCARETGVGPAPYAVIEAEADLARVPDALLPGILKTARLGYDGKGQVRVDDRAALAAAWERLGRVPCVLEQRLALRDELSVIVARGADGAIVHFPVQRNLHRDGILAVTEVWPGNVPDALAQRAVAATHAIAVQLHYVGVLCVEFFIVDDGSADGALVVNEMAPRPHNSGHYTIDACDVSQFELQVRALAGLPLAAPRQHSAAVMLNLLGDLWWRDGQPVTPDWAGVLALPGIHLHLYGKQTARPGRKMGHLTVTAADPQSAIAAATVAAQRLGIAPWR
ncbi:MAG: 5-(carboxyamino)imidazole ribonucleotide synthase [Tepidimonas taiwanensis]|uniref:5-(carboxyamino)imidazole ribonucleotide synthase n=1 Tax=Tepidimonas taiwanensis TaxID=307486 RepID=UPI0005BE3301|nr:5-(carboxyamino)imidazole ribonucleotide synthase [Tepidimonas taiwanensis]MCX7693899.1 5-(carboxyamino)imidazole ribonucleotide synthase [Tepidimonas taiwanensis]MDM7463952.1 5-(carboxyamino)imidazole ribonucleotide synthase [Tepidimonas taiwanensis]